MTDLGSDAKNDTYSNVLVDKEFMKMFLLLYKSMVHVCYLSFKSLSSSIGCRGRFFVEQRTIMFGIRNRLFNR